MATVEELKVKAEKLEHELTSALSLGLRLALGSDARHKALVWDMHELTSTFLELGRAEGAEQEATKIVHCRECKFGKSLSNPTQADMRARRCHMWYATVLADGFCYAGDRAPVLAPTKEKP